MNRLIHIFAVALACLMLAAALAGCQDVPASSTAPPVAATAAPVRRASARPPLPHTPDRLLSHPASAPAAATLYIAAPTATPPPSEGRATQAQARARLETLIAQFETRAERYYNDYGFSSNRYRYTSKELTMLAIVIHLEARGEPYKTKLAVGNVVMNRVLAPGYPGKTIEEVVTRPNQFCYDPGVRPSAECVRAARDVLEYQTWVVPQNTYFFRNTRSTGNWGSHKYYKHFGPMAFYRENYAGRYNGSAVPARLYERTYRWPQYGCKPGARVRKLQTMLRALGYDLTVDGYFGEETREQVRAFQRDAGLKVDGIAGPRTLTALFKAYSP